MKMKLQLITIIALSTSFMTFAQHEVHYDNNFKEKQEQSATYQEVPDEELSEKNGGIMEISGLDNDPQEDNKEAESDDKEKSGTLAINLLHNSFAGFHPGIFGSIPTPKSFSITYYGIYWTNPAFGSPSTGNDFWFEHGAGLAFKVLKGQLLVNPSLGLAHGKLLSGNEGAVAGDGIIPSIFLHHSSKWVTADFYFAFYKALSEGVNPSRDFIFNWVNPVFNINKFIGVGAYYEQFVNTRTGEVNKLVDINQWLGGAIRFSTGKGASFTVALGKNFTNVGGNGFHKISMFIPIQ